MYIYFIWVFSKKKINENECGWWLFEIRGEMRVRE